MMPQVTEEGTGTTLKFKSRRALLIKNKHFFSKFNFKLSERIFFKSDRCSDQVSLWSIVTPRSLVWHTQVIVVQPDVARGYGTKDPRCNSTASNFVECGVKELIPNYLLSWNGR